MAKDIILNQNNEIQFLNGDFFVGDSGDQHIQTIIQANKGQFYESPLVGVGISSKINGPFDRANLSREVREQLQADGFNIKRLEISKNVDEIIFDIDAVLKDNTAI